MTTRVSKARQAVAAEKARREAARKGRDERKAAATQERNRLLKEASSAFLIETSQLVGSQFAGTVGILRALQVGERLDLVREPENAHDPKAIRIDLDGLKLGYVAREHNDTASRMLDFGLDVRAYVVGKKDNARFPQELVRVGLYLQSV